jgi:hypothetical protein
VAKHPFKPEQTHVIFHDGMLGSTLQRFDGDLTKLERFRHDPRSYPFTVSKEAPRVLVIGSAGGHEILVSLYFGAEHVTGVELNPVTVKLLREHFADFTGRLHEHDRVTLVQAEARSFLRRSNEKYDLIWLVAPDTYAAMNAATSGAYVLSESYLYTVEMIRESLNHLEESGIICAQFGELDYSRKPNRTARYVSTARKAFEDLGTPDFENHVLVSTAAELPPFALSTVLLNKSPFTSDQIRRFGANTSQVERARSRYIPGHMLEDGPVNQLIRLPRRSLPKWYESYPFDLRPVRDDSPFFWHFARFGDAWRAERRRGPLVDWENSIGERVLIQLLIFMGVFATVLLLLPLLAARQVWASVPHKVLAGLYFACLGVGFMFFEVCLIQMLTLFLGYPTYSLSVTLFGLLVFTGLGSLASSRYRARAPLALALLLGTLSVLVIFYQYGMPIVIHRFVGASLLTRAMLAVLMIAPLGFSLGAFMPLGLTTVGALTRHTREYVAWSWAVNGFFSVITAILATVLAMTLGFRVVLFAALGVYGIGAAALLRIPRASHKG